MGVVVRGRELGNLVQQFIDKHLARARVTLRPRAVYNYLDTMIAMVEAGEGIAIIPSFVLPACRNRKVVMSRPINPTVSLDCSWISRLGKRLPPGAGDFISFLQGYIARWAGRRKLEERGATRGRCTRSLKPSEGSRSRLRRTRLATWHAMVMNGDLR